MKFDKRLIIISVVLALLTTISIYFYIDNFKKQYDKSSYIEIYVAKEDISMRTKIFEDMLEPVKVRNENVLGNAVKDKTQVVGKYTVEKIFKGEQILTSRLADLERTYFSYSIPENKRAMTVQVDSVAGVDHMIRPGDYVDIIVFIGGETVTQVNNFEVTYDDAARNVFQNILVLAVNRQQGFEQVSTDKEKSQAESKTRNITIALDTIDAERLVLAKEKGTIHLALRNPQDQTVQTTNGVIRTDLINR